MHERISSVVPRNWTSRVAGAARLSAVILLAAVAAGCGDDDNPMAISPLFATIELDADPVGDPAIYLEKVSESGDLVIVNVRLRASSPLQFDTFNLEIRFDPSVVTISDISYVGTPLCECHTFDRTCQSPAETLSCLPRINGDVFLLGVVSNPNSTTECGHYDTCVPPDPMPTMPDSDPCTMPPDECPSDECPPDKCPPENCVAPYTCAAGGYDSMNVKLVTLGFRAGSVTSPRTRVDFISDPSKPDGSCEILSDLADLGVPCATGFWLTVRR